MAAALGPYIASFGSELQFRDKSQGYEMKRLFYRSPITPWLIVLASSALFTSMAPRAIVIRHDVDDIEYRELAGRYIDAVVYLGNWLEH
jgi:amino acid permease